MYCRLKRKDIFGAIEEGKEIHDLVYILNNVSFKSYDDYIAMYNFIYDNLKSYYLDKKILNYIKNIILYLNEVKKLQINDIVNLDINGYKKKCDEVINAVDGEISNLCDYDVIQMIKVDNIDNLDNDMKDIVYDLDKTDVNNIYIDIKFPDIILKQYENKIILIPEKIKGNINYDLAKEINKLMENVGLISIQNNKVKNIAEYNFHIEVATGINYLIYCINRLLNTNSLRNNNLYYFDELEIINSIENFKSCIKHSIYFLENQ